MFTGFLSGTGVVALLLNSTEPGKTVAALVIVLAPGPLSSNVTALPALKVDAAAPFVQFKSVPSHDAET